MGIKNAENVDFNTVEKIAKKFNPKEVTCQKFW